MAARLTIRHVMKRAKPTTQAKRSPVADKIDEINALIRAIAMPLPDREMNQKLEELTPRPLRSPTSHHRGSPTSIANSTFSAGACASSSNPTIMPPS